MKGKDVFNEEAQKTFPSLNEKKIIWIRRGLRKSNNITIKFEGRKSIERFAFEWFKDSFLKTL